MTLPNLLSRSAAAEPAIERDAGSPMALYREAYVAMSAGEWHEARRILLGLWTKSRTYDVAASLGQVEYQLLNFVAAARYMAFAVANIPPKESYATLERYRGALEEIRAWVGTVDLRTNAEGAEIRIDGELVGRAPLQEPLFVAPGTRVVEVSGAGAGISTRKITIAAGERLSLVLDLRLPSTTTAEVNPTTRATQSALVAERDGAVEKRSWVPVYIGAGIAATSALAAAGFGLSANDAEDDAERLRERVGESGCATGRAAPSDCRAAADAVSRQRQAATLSTIGIGVAAVAATATVAYVVLLPGRDSRRAGQHSAPVLALQARASGLSLAGTF